MIQFWDNRYRSSEYAYGIKPNEFFKEYLMSREPGRLLLPAEGEGRNATFAAERGWKVEAFDFSVEGQIKAFQLADERRVSFSYWIEEYSTFQPTFPVYDAVALIYTHTSPKERKCFHSRLFEYLAPGGEIVLEGFSKKQFRKPSGGPKNEEMLWDMKELKEDFEPFDIVYAEELDIALDEGLSHHGIASVIRLIAKKES